MLRRKGGRQYGRLSHAKNSRTATVPSVVCDLSGTGISLLADVLCDVGDWIIAGCRHCDVMKVDSEKGKH